MTEAKDMRDEINTKINQYQHEIEELQIMVKKERIEKDEWSEKFASFKSNLLLQFLQILYSMFMITDLSFLFFYCA